MSLFLHLRLLIFTLVMMPVIVGAAPVSVDIGISYGNGHIVLDDDYHSTLTEDTGFRPEIGIRAVEHRYPFYKNSSVGYYLGVGGGYFRLTEQERFGYKYDFGTSANATYLTLLPTVYLDFEDMPTIAVGYGVGYWDVSGNMFPDGGGIVDFNYSGLRQTEGIFVEGSPFPPEWNMYMGFSHVTITLSSSLPGQDLSVSDNKFFLVKRYEW